jgi:GAF domain-containing protein
VALLQTFADQAVIAIENVRLFNELKESLEQQTATSEILGVIASSPTDIQPVLDTVAKNAARVCGATDATIVLQVQADVLQKVTGYGPIRGSPIGREWSINRNSVGGRVFVDRETIHIHDFLEVVSDYPDSRALREGYRTMLATPLLREGVPIGVIAIRRTEVHPFTEKQIKLLETFASQAVIAIENVRLFKEIQERNAELREALEHQTATAEVLGIISRSPTDVQPVLDAIVESAARVCGIDDVHLRLRSGNVMISRAHFGPIHHGPVEVSIDAPPVRWVRERGTLHIPDVRAQNEIQLIDPGPLRTFLTVPLRQQEEVIGALVARRTEVRPFTPAQIKLLETFADQAVIAIENVRLFNELKDSLEQQTATSEILGVIASSPTDIQPVLDTVAKNAARLCDASDVRIWRVDGHFLQRVAVYGPMPDVEMRRTIIRGSPAGRAVVDRQTVHVEDLTAAAADFPNAVGLRTGIRTVLATPLLREGNPIGVIHIRRTEVRPFSEKQVALLKIFADQAVIAIENVRLFKELQERNAELREALEHQTATAEVLGIISRSPTDVQPVLDAIVESAAKVCGIDDVVLRLREGNAMVSRAHFGPIIRSNRRVEMSLDEPWLRWMHEHGTLHIPDVRAAQNDFPILGMFSGFRTFLGVPLCQQGESIGILTGRRNEVRPFTPAQVKLFETFADQAVIAIENVRLFQELKESLEQQTATSEILGVIASSPTDIQPVLDTIADSAARVCNANDATIRLAEGDMLRLAVHRGPIATFAATELPIERDWVTGRALLDRQLIHIEDVQSVAAAEFPRTRATTEQEGTRTVLVVPLVREDTAIGTILIRRTEVLPFSDKQIALLKTFASQAVIAIENVRLFNELKEALEQQTATSGILGIIARSPTDLQPMLDAVAESAARLCEATDASILRVDGEILWLVASYGSLLPIAEQRPLNRATPSGRAIIERQTIHIRDLQGQLDEFPQQARTRGLQGGIRTVLATPLYRERTPIGAILIRRTEVRPFTDKQIALLKTFADQAVIAIENESYRNARASWCDR